jgi:two-component system, LytTR family, response regulator
MGCFQSQNITAKSLRRKKINIDFQILAPLRLRSERKNESFGTTCWERELRTVNWELGTMIHTLIIDDEPHIRDTLRKLLARHCPQVSVIGEAANVAEGIRAIQKLHPDLVLLDINMKDGTGFDLLNAFPKIKFKVIFISAFDKNTIRAFKLSSLEYLMKPVNPVELTDAINKVINTELRFFALQLETLKLNMRNE